MVAFAQTFSSRASTLFGLDSVTSGKTDKSVQSDIAFQEKGNTLSEKDDEDKVVSSPYEDDEEDTIVSLEDVISQHVTFRENKLYALFLRPETADLLEAASIDDEVRRKSEISSLMFKSNEHLHTFAELVTEDLIKLADGHIVLTPLCQRMIATLAEEWEDD